MVVLLEVAAFGVGPAAAGEIWGNNATAGNVTIGSFDSATGALIRQFIVPKPEAVTGNGRDVVVVGDIIYSTLATGGTVLAANKNTYADLGVVFDSGLGGVAAIAWDGSTL